MSVQKDYDFGESAYGREKELSIMRDDTNGVLCDCCEEFIQKRPVLCMDVSNGEYGPMSICYQCVSRLVKDFEEEFISKHIKCN